MVRHRNCNLTTKEIGFAINEFSLIEYKHKKLYPMDEDLVHECMMCRNGFNVVGEILRCPKCKIIVCWECVYPT